MLSGISCLQIDQKATYRLHPGRGRWSSRRRCCPCGASVQWPAPGRAVEGPQIPRLSRRGWGMHLGGEILETSGKNVETIGDFVPDVCALRQKKQMCSPSGLISKPESQLEAPKQSRRTHAHIAPSSTCNGGQAVFQPLVEPFTLDLTISWRYLIRPYEEATNGSL